MKRHLVMIAASVILLTSCSSPKPEEQPQPVTETTTATTTVTTSEAVTTTEAAEAPVPMIERKIGNMTIRLDPAMWETPEEYSDRMNADGIPVEAGMIEEMNASADIVYVMRDTTKTFLYISAEDFSGIEGFASEEEYKHYAEVMDYVQEKESTVKKSNSSVTTRNGIMCVDTNVTTVSGTKSKIISILKDDMQYMLLIGGDIRAKDRECLNDLMYNITFD